MEKIDSFKVNHLTLKAGLYVSRIDKHANQTATTFDLRFTAPNSEPPMDIKGIHTLEHLGATFFRNSAISEQVVYFGPMGCRTGFYLVLFNLWDSEKLLPLVLEFCKFVLEFSGDLPGATAIECGNYLDQDLEKAKQYIKKYQTELINEKRLKY